ncbi:MAG TPA: transposase [Solirubrobacteraceae bacterium]|nr:transposase [Solirubrobacteraceae bacterium]
MQIVLSAVGEGRSVQEVCEEHDISAGTYHQWRATTVHGAMRALDEQTDGASAHAADDER